MSNFLLFVLVLVLLSITKLFSCFFLKSEILIFELVIQTKRSAMYYLEKFGGDIPRFNLFYVYVSP